MTASCSSVRRKRLRDVERAAADRQLRTPTCTNVLPGGNGPSTVTRVPLTLACGDDPSMIVGAGAPSGMSNTNGVGGFTGARALLTMSSR